MAAIPFFDARAGYEELAGELDAAALRVLRSGAYILGEEVAAFERAFAAYCGAAHCVGVGNGLDALTLILRALGVGPGDEVVVPGHTFIATWLAVSAVGAIPVPVEPDPRTYNVTTDGVERALGPRTKAVVCVHLHGRLVDAGPLAELCRGRGIPLVEDAAQAHGATGPAGRAGSLADAAAFSFYPTKNLGAYGDGGAVTTSHGWLAERVALLRNYGSRRKYDHQEVGVNSRLDPLQAALLGVRLAHLDTMNARRRALVECYLERLDGVPGLKLPAPAGEDHVWHVLAVLAEDRDRVQAALSAAGIGTLVHYPIPPHRSGAYARDGAPVASLPVTEDLCARGLSLPLFPQLAPAAVDAVCEAVRAASRSRSALPAR
ncbi:MAG: Aminotransferase, DegT/DnrJ/EryC1/StrS family [uncultured Solirubrobacteraceae bacterium]|uniref:Aminotransferase, DegT/DnrJ/EryC1/StrS family n=1 Tax=uncultured Solirubrobacteraceae bacterium TaxID=1162706 RepID=A0A6J4TLK5_9ACTN|nr:MAG: Aminotransferase, DegT/DnrJ/EryC1/StrS family [uncultured Solirubrobacteraceae bacterium]